MDILFCNLRFYRHFNKKTLKLVVGKQPNSYPCSYIESLDDAHRSQFLTCGNKSHLCTCTTTLYVSYAVYTIASIGFLLSNKQCLIAWRLVAENYLYWRSLQQSNCNLVYNLNVRYSLGAK